METQTQDTHPQDPIDRFALHIEGMRRMSVPRGLARIVHILLVEFFVFLLCWAADIAERRRNGTLPEVAPVAAREPRAWPVELSPRESGWVERRNGGTMHGQFEQPETASEIEEPIAGTPCQVPEVEKPVTANIFHWPPLTPALICFAAQALKGRGGSKPIQGFLRFDSKNRVLPVASWRVENVPISK